MKREVAEAWVKDLRTNPPKTTRRLFDGEGYCCLGRLALVLGCEFTSVNKLDYLPTLNGEVMQVEAYLSQELMDLSGMKSRNGVVGTTEGGEVVLAELNDDGMSFAEIADVIEQHWDKL